MPEQIVHYSSLLKTIQEYSRTFCFKYSVIFLSLSVHVPGAAILRSADFGMLKENIGGIPNSFFYTRNGFCSEHTRENDTM